MTARLGTRAGIMMPEQTILRTASRSRLSQPAYTVAVTIKYYTHFLTRGAERASVDAHEWSGVVELRAPLGDQRARRELRDLLAVNFNLDSRDIRILQWARLH